MAGGEDVVTADQGGPINLGKSKADCSFRVLEQGSHLILEPVETVHVPATEAWLFRNRQALSSVRRGLEQVANRRNPRRPWPGSPPVPS
jgi:hypothetical protein